LKINNLKFHFKFRNSFHSLVEIFVENVLKVNFIYVFPFYGNAYPATFGGLKKRICNRPVVADWLYKN